MDPLSRRSFFATSAGAAGTVALMASPASAATANLRAGKSDDHESGQHNADPGSSGVVVHVRDAANGEVVIYAADSEIVVTDRNLIAAISRATHGKG